MVLHPKAKMWSLRGWEQPPKEIRHIKNYSYAQMITEIVVNFQGAPKFVQRQETKPSTSQWSLTIGKHKERKKKVDKQ